MGITCHYKVLILSCSYLTLTKALMNHQNLEYPLLPPDFLFGTASSAYQFEGAYLTDGKSLSNWDEFTHKPGKILDGSNGDIAVDHYHRYLEDINIMSSLGVNSYRFSISWARVLPKGRFGDVNIDGINFYTHLIDALLLKGIKPFVTLNHFDVPKEIEDRYGGWLSPESQKDFAYFSEICFKFFGDRVKHWVTINEPNIQAILSYRYGRFPPARCSNPFGNCSYGDSEREPFVAAHNLILSHAAAVSIYRTKFQKHQGGNIGIVVHAIWYEPVSSSKLDEAAAQRAQSFFTNWFLDPIMFGKYPAEMEEILGDILPKFSTEDKIKLKTSLDFIGINHYSSFYVQDCIYSHCQPGIGVSKTEGFYLQSSKRNGVPIGDFREPCTVDWINVHPQGMEKIVNYITKRYNNTPIFITENGYGCHEDPKSGIKDSLNDIGRVNYMAGYLESLLKAIRNGADVRGYFVWSLLDNFEWADGYSIRFGINHVDYATLERTKKLSATWYQNFIASHNSKTLVSH